MYTFIDLKRRSAGCLKYILYAMIEYGETEVYNNGSEFFIYRNPNLFLNDFLPSYN